MRVYLIWFVVVFMSFFAWRDWYKGVAGLTVLMAIVERPDFPKAVAGISGFNPWNMLFLVVLASWFFNKAKEVDIVNLPKNVRFYLAWYFVVVVISVIRELGDYGAINEYFELLNQTARVSVANLLVDDLFNTLKYAIPGVLLYWGCASRDRFVFAVGSVMLMNLLLALQVIQWMPLGGLIDGDQLEKRAIRVLDRQIGYFRVDLSTLLAGAAWAVYAFREVLKSAFHRALMLGASGAIVLGMALTGGRAGMGAWAATACVLAFYRWRGFLLLVPLVILAIMLAAPAVIERMGQGITESSSKDSRNIDGGSAAGKEGAVDVYTITAGRTSIWPYVVAEIEKSPWVGHGRRAMLRTGVGAFLSVNYAETFPHPHNAYLELLLDNGWIMATPIFIFYLVLLVYSLSLFRDSENKIYIVAGAIGFSFIFTQLLGSVGAQSFYPRTGTFSMWCAMGLMLRVYVERERLRAYSRKSKIPREELTLWEIPREETKKKPWQR